MDFPSDSAVKNLPASTDEGGWLPELGDSLEKGIANIPVFLLGEFHGQRSLAGYSPQGLKESDRTEQLQLSLSR